MYTRRELWLFHHRFIVDFAGNDSTDSFKLKEKIGQTGKNGTNSVEVMVPLKYLCNFWRTLEMPLINCEINLVVTWSVNCVVSSNAAADPETTSPIIDTKLYVPVVILSTQDSAKLLQ